MSRQADPVGLEQLTNVTPEISRNVSLGGTHTTMAPSISHMLHHHAQGSAEQAGNSHIEHACLN
jgi:hypothetical protein